MMVTEASAYEGPGRRRRYRTLWLALLVAFAVVLWGGYDRHWGWTGLHGRSSLWDWLALALLPVAIGLVPLWMSRPPTLTRRTRIVIVAVPAAFVLLVVLGYSLHWKWTGFPGRTLWDWLELLALPLAVTAGPVWLELRKGGVHARERIALVVVSLAFVFVSVGAYVWHWKWAGFDGNKLWDWLSLWLLPLLVPLVLLPALLSAVGTGEDEADAGASPTAGR